ncbi:hypothetical protein F4805DRAFT_417959 [Annulohypoxylon moriforme]|nr:hypothetical protein F4805DRAFT_417959 [Annulohypoxylon moriforme]
MSSSTVIPRSMAGLDHLSQVSSRSGLRHLWKDFESKLSDLFVDDKIQSRIGVAVVGRNQVQWVSTPQDLYTSFGKGVPTLL